MRAWISGLAAAAVLVGCQSQPKPAPQASNPSVLDVSASRRTSQVTVYEPAAYAPPPARSTTPGPAYAPPVQAPEYVPPPQDPAVATAAPAAGRYTVKHGDTLYHIAKDRYGDGKKWTQIAAANPGVTPASLKVGQKLIMP